MNWISVGKEKRVDPNSTTYTNFKTKQIINFNVKHETIKLTHTHTHTRIGKNLVYL